MIGMTHCQIVIGSSRSYRYMFRLVFASLKLTNISRPKKAKNKKHEVKKRGGPGVLPCPD
jgi:hypothetical protein